MTIERRKSDRRVSPAIAEFALQERGELLARIAELEQQVSGIRLDVITQIDAHAVTREKLAALKEQHRGGVAQMEKVARLQEALERLTSAARDADIGYLDAAISNAEAALAGSNGGE